MGGWDWDKEEVLVCAYYHASLPEGQVGSREGGEEDVVSGERGRGLIARAKRWGSPREEKTEAKGRKGRRGVATPGQEKEAAPRARRRDHLSPHCMRA